MRITLVCIVVAGLAALCCAGNTPPPPPKDHDLTQYTTETPDTEISGRLGGGLGGGFRNCFDRHRFCGYWAGQGLCYSSYYSNYLRRTCRRSCNSCFNQHIQHPHGIGGFNNNRYNNQRRW